MKIKDTQIRESIRKMEKRELERTCEYFIRNYEEAVRKILKLKQRYEYGTLDKND